MTIKQERAAQLIQEIVGELLMFEVTDPALQSVTVTEVSIDRELEYAQVFVHSMNDRKEVMAGLTRATGFLRHGLAARTSFRKAPVLSFTWDVSMDRGDRVDTLLATIKTSDVPAPAQDNAQPDEADEFDEEMLDDEDFDDDDLDDEGEFDEDEFDNDDDN